MKTILYTNRQALHDYTIIEKFEAGIQLSGPEVKSCLSKLVSLQNGYISIDKNELIMYNTHIATYDNTFNKTTYNDKRNRKLLMHKKEIIKLAYQVKNKGLTIIPLSIYTNDAGFIKVEIALAKGKHNYDKREFLKEKTIKKEMKSNYR